MSDKKIITVFGATGRQGGAVVSTFLNDQKLRDEWIVRAAVRDVSKEPAKKLVEQGVEVVVANLDDKPSLVRAMQGAYAVFGVTNYWEKLDMQYEIQQGKNLADAAKETGVQHYIWSSLDDVKKISNGKLLHVYHFDSKAEIEAYTRRLGIPATFFLAGFYMPNIPGELLKPLPMLDSSTAAVWTLAMPCAPTTRIPTFDPRDTGKYVKAIVRHRTALLGQRFLGADKYISVQEMVDAFKRAFPEDAGKTARACQLDDAVFREGLRAQGSPEYVVDELAEMGRLMDEYGYYGGAPLEPWLQYVEDPLTSWEEYIQTSEVFAGLK